MHAPKTIAKFNFNKLFAEAWLKVVIPADVMAGFKICSVYQ